MRSPWPYLLGVVVLQGFDLLPAAGQPATLPPVAAPAPTLPAPQPAATSAATFVDKVGSFVADFYLSSDAETEDEVARIYAATVDYFGNRRWPRTRVIAEKRAYTARWPKRVYRLLRETLVVTPRAGMAKVYDVRFAYEFDVSGPGRRSRGRGQTLLTLDLASEGGRITRETGTVTARW